MCAAELDWKKLDEIWNERARKLFREFCIEFLGCEQDIKKLPACYGSGDGHGACSYCEWSSGC